MSLSTLNLASRPFRNERLPALLIALGFTVAGAVTVKHAAAIRGLMPRRTSGLALQVRQLEEERARLRSEAGGLRAPRPEPASVTQWTLLKQLVDQRTFSWSGLFAVLEESLPKGVRLISITPTVKDGIMTLDLAAVARSDEDVLETIRALEERPEFDEVLPRTRSGQGELSFRLTTRYRPSASAPAAAAAGTTREEGASASPSPAASGAPLAAASPASPAAGTGSATGSAPRSAAASDPTGSASAADTGSATGPAPRRGKPRPRGDLE